MILDNKNEHIGDRLCYTKESAERPCSDVCHLGVGEVDPGAHPVEVAEQAGNSEEAKEDNIGCKDSQGKFDIEGETSKVSGLVG